MHGPAHQWRMPDDLEPGRPARWHADAEVISRRVEGDLHRARRTELTVREHRLAGALAAAGLAPGDGVATLAWNGHRHVELALAACATGRRLVPLDPTDHSDMIVRAARDAQVRIIFFDLSFMPLVEEIARRLSPVSLFVALTDGANMPGPGSGPELRCYENLLEEASPSSGSVERGDAHQSRRPDQRSGAASPARRGLSFRAQDRVLAAIPMFHPEGRFLAGAVWAAGAGLVLPGPWLDGRSLHALLAGQGASVVAAPVPVWRGLLAHVERAGASLAGLRLAILSGDVAAQGAVADALRDRHRLETLCLSPTAPLHRWGDARGAAPLGSGTTSNESCAKEETQ